jgi:hypothetical protein
VRGPVTDATDANDTIDELRILCRAEIAPISQGSERQLEHPCSGAISGDR